MRNATPPIPTPLRVGLDTAVSINGLLVPMRQAVQVVARFCRPLIIYNPDSSYELSFPGSAFAMRVAGRNYLVASLHQLGDGDAARSPDEVVILDRRVQPVAAVPGREAAIERNLDLFALAFRETSQDRDLAPLFCRMEPAGIRDASDMPPGTRVLAYSRSASPRTGRAMTSSGTKLPARAGWPAPLPDGPACSCNQSRETPSTGIIATPIRCRQSPPPPSRTQTG